MRAPENAPNRWGLDDIPLDAIDLPRVRPREDLFYLVAAASLIEIAADLYSANLTGYFTGDEEITHWLQRDWRQEEVRHGQALRSYVGQVWPEFDWDAAFSAFFADYSRQCTVDEFEPSGCLEMVARCVVETGTATFYQTLAAQTDEPVLAGVAARIRAEEINHYKHFYRYYRKLAAIESPSRWQIFTALRRRVFEARNEDAECALWHVFVVRTPSVNADKAHFRQLCSRLGRQTRQHYPVTMAAKMLLKPLDLPSWLARFAQGPVARWAAWMLQR